MGEPKPIREQLPIELGGQIARSGFIYQDHVAAGFCLALELEATLKEVWCETEDDVTLIWQLGEAEHAEFVQVKSNQLGQLWSVAELCKREGSPPKGVGTSLLEKSLAHDRNKEDSRFRLVTLRDINQELKSLTFPIGSPARTTDNLLFKMLSDEIVRRMDGYVSPNNNGASFWVERTVWQVTESEHAVQNANLLKLHHIAESVGSFLVTDQLKELYGRLLAKVQRAASAQWAIDPTTKKFIKKDFCKWLRQTIDTVAHPAAHGTGKKLREKMEKAGLAEEDIRSADEARRSYRRFLLEPQYQKSAAFDLVNDEVVAKLQRMRSELDTGQIADSGVQFHARCLASLDELQPRVSCDAPRAFLQGCMYNITDRCLHRFVAVMK